MKKLHGFLFLLASLAAASRPSPRPPRSRIDAAAPSRQFASEARDGRGHINPSLKRVRDYFLETLFGSSARIDTRPLRRDIWASYGNDVVVRFNVTTSDEEAAIEDAVDRLFKDVWAYGKDYVDIRMDRDDLGPFLSVLPKSLKTAYTTLISDVASLVHRTYPPAYLSQSYSVLLEKDRLSAPQLLRDGDNIFFNDYQPLPVIVRWMRLLEALFPSLAEVISIGTSYEGRDIPALRVSIGKEATPESPRKTLVVTGGLHAREWISTTTVNYVAWSYITQYGKERMITKFLEEFDIVFIPVVNPDGVEYTWQVDRLWRKSRQHTNFRFCRGLDLDHAFGYEWDGTGASGDPCSESYGGSEPFQAVEAQQLAEWAQDKARENINFVGLIDLHSYSQQVLFPYSYSCSVHPPNFENLAELALGLAKGIRLSSGEIYSVSSACKGVVAPAPDPTTQKRRPPRIESGGGSAIDWFYHEMSARYSYQIKLRDTGSYGFLLPREYIVPTGEEIFSAFKYLGDFLLGNNGIEGVDDLPSDRDGVSLSQADRVEEGLPPSVELRK